MRYYNPEFFKPYEYLPPEVYRKLGDSGIILIDPRILWTLDHLRRSFDKPITVNNWRDGGIFQQRGFRTITVEAEFSQHYFGRAVDCEIQGVPAAEFRSAVKKGKYADELTYITRIEDGVDWIHLDCAAVPGIEIFFFNK